VGDKLPAEVKSKVEAEVANVRKALESKDTETIKRATEKLYVEVQQIGSAVYGQGGPQGGAQGGPQQPGEQPGEQPGGEQPGQGPQGGDEEVVDGEFRNL
jgi:molecular chaperone DnaK